MNLIAEVLNRLGGDTIEAAGEIRDLFDKVRCPIGRSGRRDRFPIPQVTARFEAEVVAGRCHIGEMEVTAGQQRPARVLGRGWEGVTDDGEGATTETETVLGAVL